MIEFASCFSKKKIKKIQNKVLESQKYIKMLSKKEIKLPEKVECMTIEEIKKYKKIGAGHGLYVPPKTIKINPHMDGRGILFNYIHENIHYVVPNASENLVDYLTDLIAYQMKLKR